MFELGVVSQLEAAHQLKGDFGPASRLHGHTYRVEVAVRGPSLRQDGTLCDMGRLQQVVQEVVGGMHYRNLNELPEFEDRNTTAEVVAQRLGQEVASRLRGLGLTALGVRVWESPQAFAGYEASLD